MGIAEVRPWVVDKFTGSMTRLRSQPGLLECAPPTVMFKEQMWLIRLIIKDNKPIDAVLDLPS